MKLDFKSRKETSILQRKRDKGWLNGRFREWENKRCDDNNKTNKILHMCTGKGSRQAADKTKNITRHQLYKLLTEIE